jgi:hypothetical protein
LLRCQDSSLYINRGREAGVTHHVFRVGFGLLYPLPCWECNRPKPSGNWPINKATVGTLPSIISIVVKIRFVRVGCLGAKTPLYIYTEGGRQVLLILCLELALASCIPCLVGASPHVTAAPTRVKATTMIIVALTLVSATARSGPDPRM